MAAAMAVGGAFGDTKSNSWRKLSEEKIINYNVLYNIIANLAYENRKTNIREIFTAINNLEEDK